MYIRLGYQSLGPPHFCGDQYSYFHFSTPYTCIHMYVTHVDCPGLPGGPWWVSRVVPADL